MTMKAFTFQVRADVTAYAETEEKARESLLESEEDEDVQYGKVGVYIPGVEFERAELVGVFDIEEEW